MNALGRRLHHWLTWPPQSQSFLLHFVDSPFWGAKIPGSGRRHVEGLGFALQTGSCASHGYAAFAGADDVVDELLAVHAYLHGAPVFCQFLWQLHFISRVGVLSMLGQSVKNDTSYNQICYLHNNHPHILFTRWMVLCHVTTCRKLLVKVTWMWRVLGCCAGWMMASPFGLPS